MATPAPVLSPSLAMPRPAFAFSAVSSVEIFAAVEAAVLYTDAMVDETSPMRAFTG